MIDTTGAMANPGRLTNALTNADDDRIPAGWAVFTPADTIEDAGGEYVNARDSVLVEVRR